MTLPRVGKVALLSLERWDDVWRRNQHLAHQLVRQGLAESVIFVEPPVLSRTRRESWSPEARIRVVPARLRLPKRLGGLRLLGSALEAVTGQCDVLWINDPTLGVHCVVPGQPAVYDVTDDWREFGFPARIRRRVIAAESRLARRATTVVCSETLRDRWMKRYGVSATVVNNGVDADLWRQATALELPGPAPHVGYIGTLQSDRLDERLVQQLAAHPAIGTVHLVGPDALDDRTRALLTSSGVRLHGAVPAREVPRWTLAMDVLISPHRISAFTLSLDAIKSYEYLASGRPIVATATSGFQLLDAEQLTVTDHNDFTAAVETALTSGKPVPPSFETATYTWTARAHEFADALAAAQGRNSA